jgi:hypothetical protein
MGRRIALIGMIGAVLGGAATLAAVPNGASQAASGAATFTVPANDGYGVGDCLLSGGACGQVVANQWCEAQGFNRATSFAAAEIAEAAEVTGSVRARATASRPVSITCGD